MAERVAVHDPGIPPRRDLAEAVAQPVDARHRGEGVVDRRRQGAYGDLDQLIDGEREVLRQRAVGTGDMGALETAGNPGRGVGRPHRREWETFHEEVAGPVEEPDHPFGLSGDVDEVGVGDELQVAARGGRNRRAVLLQTRLQLVHRRTGFDGVDRGAVAGGDLGVDGERQVAGNARDHLRQLDRRGDVVDEVDEDAQRGEHETERDRD